eukprot:1549468-Pleurochrysis_carterae.AAC.6
MRGMRERNRVKVNDGIDTGFRGKSYRENKASFLKLRLEVESTRQRAGFSQLPFTLSLCSTCLNHLEHVDAVWYGVRRTSYAERN